MFMFQHRPVKNKCLVYSKTTCNDSPMYFSAGGKHGFLPDTMHPETCCLIIIPLHFCVLTHWNLYVSLQTFWGLLCHWESSDHSDLKNIKKSLECKSHVYLHVNVLILRFLIPMLQSFSLWSRTPMGKSYGHNIPPMATISLTSPLCIKVAFNHIGWLQWQT